MVRYIGVMNWIYKLSLILLVFTISHNAQAQSDVWKSLGKITYTKEYDEFLGFKVDKPVFSQAIKDMEGSILTIKGFIIPVEGYKSHKEFVFSAYPYNMCFFCGGAGPETVMEVYSSQPIEYTAEPIYIKGTLRLNSDDINRLMYALEDVVLVEK
jgi:hypothetical protein